MTLQELGPWMAERVAAFESNRITIQQTEKPIVKPQPVDAARRRVIGYNGFGQVKRNGQVFRTHSGR